MAMGGRGAAPAPAPAKAPAQRAAGGGSAQGKSPFAGSGSLASDSGGARSELLQESGTSGDTTPSVNAAAASPAQSPLASQLASAAVPPMAAPQAAPALSPLQAAGRPQPATNPTVAWKYPIQQAFDQARAAASTPGVGITDPVALEQARQARQQAILAAKPMGVGGFTGDPNSLIPRGTTSGGVNQYFNPATGGMFVGNPFRNWNTGGGR